MIKTSPSSVGGAGLIPAWGAKIQDTEQEGKLEAKVGRTLVTKFRGNVS